MTRAVGIDVGGTKIAAGLVETATSAILAREAIATLAARGGKAVLDDTVDLARRLFAVAKHPVDRIGVDVPQLVDNAGCIRSAYNFDWKSAPVRECLAALAPTTIESDVRAAALVEAAFGAGKGHRQFAYVTVGTGLSYCLVLDGRPYAGANGFAIHFASSALHLLCDSCGAVNRPVLEDIAAGPAIAAAYERRSGRRVAGAESVLAVAAEGDAEVMAVVDAAADQLDPLVALIVNMLDPAAILLGGGLGLAPGRYRDRLVAATRAHVWAESCRDLPILPAALGADAGLIGAALAAMS